MSFFPYRWWRTCLVLVGLGLGVFCPHADAADRLVIGGDSRYPPYEFVDNKGQPAGYCVDLSRALAEELGVEVEIRLAPWPVTLHRLKTGEIDAVQGMFYSQERASEFSFTAEHAVVHHVSVVREGRKPPGTVEALRGLSLVVMDGDIMHEFARQHGLDVATEPSMDETLAAVVEGVYDCALVARLPAHYWKEKSGWTSLVIGTRSLLSPSYCYAVPFGKKSLRADLSEGLTILEERGVHRQIYSRWLGLDDALGPDVARIIRWGGVTLACLCLALAGFMHWNRTLAQSVAKRTRELEAEQSKLQVSEARLRNLFDNMTTGVAELEPVDDGRDFVVRVVNPAAAAMVQLDRDDIVGRRLKSLFSAIEETGILRCFQAACETGEPQSLPALEYRDDRLREWVELRAFRLQDGRVVVLFDLRTKEHQFEEQVQRTDKLDSVSRLAGGVAHDFKNMLQVIAGYTQYARSSLDKDRESVERSLIEIEKATDRSAGLVKQLLTFARENPTNATVLNLNTVVEGVLGMLRGHLGEDIHLHWHPGDNLWEVKIDKAQMEQAIVNLVVNARDAISGSGTIEMRTRNRLLVEENVEGLRVTPGEYVMLEVQDSGCGMTATVKRQIFEPFFTTKFDGQQGTGLGLPTLYGTVVQAGGDVLVDSEPGEGATFTVYLPNCRLAAEADSVEERKPLNRCGRGERILVVEDEALLLNVVCTQLNDLGFKSYAAQNITEAVRVLDAEGPVDLLVSDLVMPDMNGVAVWEHLKSRQNEQLKVLYITGYESNVIAGKGISIDDAPILVKPFSEERLGESVRELLNG